MQETEKQENLLYSNLKKLIVMVVLVLVLPFSVVSQEIENLVLNPGFEDIDTCLNRLSTFSSEWNSVNDFSMKSWRTIVRYSSPGYVSNCVNPTIGNPAFQPNTPYGLQLVRETGNNYLFMGNFQQNEYFIYRYFGAFGEEPQIFKESFTGTLKNELIVGKVYYLEFYVNQVNLNLSNPFNISTDAFDILIHTDTNYIPRAESPYVNPEDIVWGNPAGNIVKDTLNWVKLSGCFIPDKKAKYFTIGSFRDTSEMNNLYYSYNETTYGAAYYYDDFLIYQCDTCCPDQYPVQDYITVNNTLLQQGDPVYFETFLNKGNTANLYLFDSAGRIVYQHYLSGTDNTHQIPISLAAGIYHYAMVTSEKKKLGGKIVVF